MIDAAFESRFQSTLHDAGRWVAWRTRAATACGEFGTVSNNEVHFVLLRSDVSAELRRAWGYKGKAGEPARGIYLKSIMVPAAQRRLGYATRIIDRVLREARAAKLDYVFVEAVISREMHQLMRARPEFVAAPHDCYLAVLK